MTNPASSGDNIIIHAVGSVGPRRVEYGEPVESLLAGVHQKIKQADIATCHTERIFSDRGCMQYRDHNTWESRVDPRNVKTLVHGGFNVVFHAGNRCFDWGPDALVDSINAIRAAGLQVVGVGKDIVEARTPAILERKGVKVGILDYNSVLPVEYEAREGKPGCAPIRVSTYYEAQGYQPGTPPKVITVAKEEDIRAVEDDIRKLRGRVDVVIVSIHWGQDFVMGALTTYQPVIGHRAIEAGADVVLGAHGHNIRGVEIYKGRPIFYCIGSFAEERSPHPKPPGAWSETVPLAFRRLQTETGWERNPGHKDRRYTMMVRFAAGKGGIRKASFFPAYTNQKAEPELLSRSDPRFQEVLDYIEPQCKQIGTTLTVEGDEVVVRTQP
ncbi:MAG: CapA family protein [Chloroflexi bacterium]|nr:CapA family protein [Chloroflexota bacterium]